MSRDNGIAAPNPKGLALFLNRILVFLSLFMLGTPSSGSSFQVPYDSLLSLQGEWRLGVTTLQPDGEWSPLDSLFFRTHDEQNNFVVRVYRDSSELARLVLKKQQFQPRQLTTHKRLRKAVRSTTVDFDGHAPLNPLLSSLPLQLPAFPLQEGETPYTMQRTMNGRQLPPENITQLVSSISFDELMDALPAALSDQVADLVPHDATFYRVAAYRGEKRLFEQYWASGQPWALFTSSDHLQAWLVR